MATPRWRLGARIVCGLVLIPPLLWLMVVLIAPTGWARRRLAAELEARTGRRVALAGVSIGWTGGIRLSGLEIGSPRGTSDPWLKAEDIRLDFGLFRLLGGRWRPSRLELDGVELRVLRRGDGTIELADFLRPVSPPRIDDGRKPQEEPRIDVRLRRAGVTVVDEPTGTRLAFRDAEGEGFAEGPLAVVEQLHGSINGGEVRFAARLDRTASNLFTRARLRADDVPLDEGMKVLQYVVPVLAGASPAVKGRLNADIQVMGRGPTWTDLCRDLSGRGDLALNRVSVDGTPLIAQLSRFVEVGPRQIGSIRTDFIYRSRRFATDHLALNLGRMPIAMSGWTDLDGNLDYRIKISGLDEGLPDQARRLLGELKVDVGSLASLSVRGTLDRMEVEVNGVPIDARKLRDRLLRPDDKQRLRILGRQLRDELLR